MRKHKCQQEIGNEKPKWKFLLFWLMGVGELAERWRESLTRPYVDKSVWFFLIHLIVLVSMIWIHLFSYKLKQWFSWRRDKIIHLSTLLQKNILRWVEEMYILQLQDYIWPLKALGANPKYFHKLPNFSIRPWMLCYEVKITPVHSNLRVCFFQYVQIIMY